MVIKSGEGISVHFNLTAITECVRIFFMHSETTSLKRVTVTQSILIYA